MRINLIAPKYHTNDGYGNFAINLYRGLVRNRANVRCWGLSALYWPEELQRAQGLGVLPTILLAPPKYGHLAPPKTVHYTMYESTGLKDDWVAGMNAAPDRIIATCNWFADVLRDNGVVKPIDVINPGVDFSELIVRNKLTRPIKKPYVFLAWGDRGARKGWDIAVHAFWQAFGTPEDTPDVRLVIKTRPYKDAGGLVHLFNFEDPRLEVWDEDIEKKHEIYDMADAFVFPTRGEGWGLPPREAAASGLPVIVTRWAGTADCDQWGIGVGYELIPSILSGGGRWAYANIDEIADTMRKLYENPDWGQTVGQKAALWLRQFQQWDTTAWKFITYLRAHYANIGQSDKFRPAR